jgi:hypothetical protein
VTIRGAGRPSTGGAGTTGPAGAAGGAGPGRIVIGGHARATGIGAPAGGKGPGGPPGQGGGPPDRHAGGISYPKAVLLLLLAVALGVYLLQFRAPAPVRGNAATRTSSSTTGGTTTGSSTTTTTTSGASSSTTTTTAAGGATPTKTVHVLVANASQTNGVAAFYANKLSAAGWGTLAPVTALTALSTSSVYYASGDQKDAASIATSLGLASSSVSAIGATTPVRSSTGAQVVVVVGDDLAAKATPAG